MVRLTVQKMTPAEAILQVDGWVAGKDVDLLEREGEHLLAQAQCLVLVLQGVKCIDAAGLHLLARWSGPRLALCGGSPYVQMLLEQQGMR